MEFLRFPTVMKTQCGDLHRRWAVLDNKQHQYHPDGSSTQVHFWAEFPTVLNDQMNAQIESLTASVDERAPVEVLEVRYNWPSYQYFEETHTNEPCLVEMVVDLKTMVQRNTATGTMRHVKFFYKP